MNIKSGFFKNKKALIIILTAAVVITAAAAAYLAFGQKSARAFYLEAESKNFKQYADFIKKKYNDYKEARKPYLSGNHRTRTEITLSVNEAGSAASDKTVNGILDVAQKCKLIVDSRNNPGEKTNLTQLSLLLEKTPFLDAEVFSKDRQLYFTVPVFTPDRYFKVDTSRLTEVYDRFGIPVKPMRVPSLEAAADVIELNVDEFDSLASEYGGFISESIGEEAVKFGKTLDMDVSGQRVKGREVSVTLDGGALTSLLNGLAKKAGTDDIFTKLTYGNLAAVSEIADEAGIFRLFDYLDETGAVALNETEKELLKAINFRKDAEAFKMQLAELFKGCKFSNGIRMDLIIDTSGSILDRKVVTLIENTESGTEYEVSIHTGTNSLKYNDYRNRFLEADISTKEGVGKGTRQYFRFIPAMEPSAGEGSNKGRIELSWGIDTGDGIHSETRVELVLDASTDRLTAKENSAVKYAIEMQGNNEGQPEKIKGELKTSKWKNNKQKTRNQTTAFTIDADLPDFGITDFSAQLNLAREDKLEIEDFKLPEAAAANIVDLNTATDEELDKVWQDIMGSFGTFYMTNKPIVDAVLGE